MWKLNRAIQIDFTEDLDFSTVSGSTVRIVDSEGFPAMGAFAQVGPRSLRFQPRCPRAEDLSDAGLRPGTTYRLQIAGGAGESAAPKLLSTAGERIQYGLDVTFRTPDSVDRRELFDDPVDGPPAVVILASGDPVPTEPSGASYLEVGHDPDSVEFFRFDGSDQQGEIASEVPLNFYSDPSQQFAIVLAFDQPILATHSHLSSGVIGLEYYHAASQAWRPAPSSVALESGCEGGGATVRVTPVGVLPQGTSMRVAIGAGFEDLSGQATTTPQTSMAVFRTSTSQPIASGGGQLGQRNTGSDEILERFTVGGAGSLEDTSVPSGLPRASWGGGTLTAGFEFAGTGGPGGDFDVVIAAGQSVIIDTVFDQISGGPGGIPTTTQAIVNGLLQVRNFTIEDGGRLIFLGANTASILATGTVDVQGLIQADGGDNFGVGTLNTTNEPEEGASGQAGGGQGGTGSYLTSASTPRGGPGYGAFNVPGLGGQGGESSYAPAGPCAKDNRRAAGGGGGQLGRSVRYRVDSDPTKPLAISQTLVGMDGEPGFTGSPDGTGAVSQNAPARGGAMGQSPFLDASPNNDFFGTMLRADGRQIRGELPSVWAGAGGGAGGDAVQSATFPREPFLNTGDEKGSGGGGGAGGLMILAVGDIVIGGSGAISADGGTGGSGENTLFFDRIGAGSGGGSGGHIVLSSAGSIIVEAESEFLATGDFYADDPNLIVHEKRPLRALGGQGGAGRQDRCGAGENGESSWRGDAIPFEAFEGREDIPPYTPPNLPNTFSWCNQTALCAVGTVPIGTVIGGGGDGSPGLIQLHVTDPDTQLVFGSTGATGYVTQGIDVSRSMVPPPMGWSTPEGRPDTLVPFFSYSSESYSRWIPLGLARLNPDGSSNPVEFFFEGTNANGSVERSGEMAAELAPVVPYTAVAIGGAAPTVQPTTAILRIPGSALADPNDLYLRNPALLREFAVRFHDDGTASDEREYPIVAASYDRGSDEYAIALDSMGTQLSREIADLDSRPGQLEVEIVPFFFRLLTAGEQDRFPLGTDVRIKFDATVAVPTSGAPSSDAELAYSGRVDIAGMNLDLKNGYAEEITELNGAVAAPGQTDPTNLSLETVHWDFVRFKVEFDLATSGSVPGGDLPGLDFLRVPFRF